MEFSSTTRGAILFGFLLAVVVLPETDANKLWPVPGGMWKPAHATFYGDSDGSGTIEGACGYSNELQKKSYGAKLTVALSVALFNEGAACGSCYQLKCINSPDGCNPGFRTVLVTATNLCPGGSWCDPPKEHFDLSMPAFLMIAQQKAGVVPVMYRRVACIRKGGIRFTISPSSNPYFLLVLVWNVGGAGDTQEVWIKGSKGKVWTPMKRNWGQNWQADHLNLMGQPVNFRVKTSDGKTSTSFKVTPASWKVGRTYVGDNFR